jgi:hypothetical protein
VARLAGGPSTNKKQKNTQPTVAACWQTTLNMGWTGWFQTVPQVLGG